jgi:hypothetical protein
METRLPFTLLYKKDYQQNLLYQILLSLAVACPWPDMRAHVPFGTHYE